MKKRILFSLILGVMLLFGVFFVPNTEVATVSAKTGKIVLATDGGAGDGSSEGLDDPELQEPSLSQSQINKLFEKGHVISSSSHLTDTVLYGRLLDVVAEHAKAIGYVFTGDELYSEMFTTFAVEDKIFSITEIIIQDDMIESLDGLEYLRLDNIKKLTISSNRLKSIGADRFENMTNIQYLNLANNNLESCDITPLRDLEYVNLSSNSLEELDLSNIVSANVEINLANNNFESMADIKLPTRAHSISLNIMSNNIREIDDEYFNPSSKLKNFHVGVQGIKNPDKVSSIDTNTALKIYKTGLENVRLVINKHVNLIDREVYGEPITDANIENNCLELILPVGDYSYEYEKLVDGVYVPMYEKYSETNKIYKSQEFQVIPQKATFLYEYKGKTYETLGKVTGVVTVRLACEEGGKIFYSCGSAEWVEGDTVVCDGGGVINITVKVEKDGYTSEKQTIVVKTSLNKFVPDVLMFVLVFGLALVLFIVVIPLVSKKFFKK